MNIAAQILSAMPNALIVINQSRQIAFANVAAEEFFGTSLEVMRRRPLNMIIPPSSPVIGLIDRCLTEAIGFHEYDIDLSVRSGGGNRIVDLQVAPMATADTHHVVLVIQPRAIANTIDRQLVHRDAARSVRAMSAMLAHEIKNPLSGIRGAAQLLEHDLPAESIELTQLICSETARIAALVDRFEIFSDAPPAFTKPVNVHSVLDHVRRLAQSGFANSIRIIEDYDPSLPDVIGDQDMLTQVFLNLVKNAAEALEDIPNPEIRLASAFRPGVRLSLPGRTRRVSLPLEFSITDNGAGVPEHLQNHLFDPFVTTKSSGSGLGLALVAKIIGDHGGVVEFTSQPGRTSFRVLLPMAPEEKILWQEDGASTRSTSTDWERLNQEEML